MAQNNSATDATLTEHHHAATNPEGDEHADITMVIDSRGRWVPDTYDSKNESPVPPASVGETAHGYYVTCSCGETFSNWGAATKHAEEEH